MDQKHQKQQQPAPPSYNYQPPQAPPVIVMQQGGRGSCPKCSTGVPVDDYCKKKY